MKLATLTTLIGLSAFALGGCAADNYGSGTSYQRSNGNDYGSSYGSSYGNSCSSYGNEKPAAPAKVKVVKKVSTSLGEVFATAQGMTLYTFTKDTAAESTCYDGCAANWPPFMAKDDAKTWGEFTLIERKDGSHQWAYKNQPLYTWVGDLAEGDTHGQGIGNVWYAAQP